MSLIRRLFMMQTQSIPYNEIWYTASTMTNPYNDNFYDANNNKLTFTNMFENGNGIIKFSGNLAVIGSYAFSNCSSLTSMIIPNSVTSIEEYALYGCSSLISLTIPNSVTRIRGNSTFYNVPNIVYTGSSIGSPWGARSVNGYVDGYLVYRDASKTELLACSAATTGEITIPEPVTSIGNSAFCDCESLTSVIIPNGVTNIGSGAFFNCSSLTSVTCEAVVPPSISPNTFHNVPKTIPLYVPSGSVSAYQQVQYWYDFRNIQAIPE